MKKWMQIASLTVLTIMTSSAHALVQCTNPDGSSVDITYYNSENIRLIGNVKTGEGDFQNLVADLKMRYSAGRLTGNRGQSLGYYGLNATALNYEGCTDFIESLNIAGNTLSMKFVAIGKGSNGQCAFARPARNRNLTFTCSFYR